MTRLADRLAACAAMQGDLGAWHDGWCYSCEEMGLADLPHEILHPFCRQSYFRGLADRALLLRLDRLREEAGEQSRK